MFSATRAMVWESWRRERWMAAALTAATIALLGALYQFFPEIDDETQPFHEALQFPFLILVLICAASVSLHGQTLSEGYYRLPVPVWHIALVRLIVSMVTAVAMYLAVAVFLNLAFATNWPLLGPSLFIAATVSCLQAIAWSRTAFPYLQIAVGGALSVALTIWLADRYGRRFENWRVWDRVTPNEWLLLVSMMLLAYVAGTLLLKADRHGIARGWGPLPVWWNRLLDAMPRGDLHYSSPQSAQFWMEVRAKGTHTFWLIGSFYGCALLVYVALDLYGGASGAPALEEMLFLTFGVTVMMVSPVQGLISGSSRMRGHVMPLPMFAATRPLTDRAICCSTMRAAAAILLLVWLMAIVTAVLAFAWYSIGNEAYVTWPSVSQASRVALAYAITSWVLMSAVMSVCMAGRSNVLAAVVLTGAGLLIAISLAENLLLPAKYERLFRDLMVLAISAALQVGTLVAFVVAVRRRYLHATTGVLCLAAWIGLCWYMLYPMVAQQGLRQAPLIVLMCSLLILSLTPLAVAPIALAWNRHR